MSDDYYKILSVEPTASQKEIHETADRLISVLNKKRGLSFNKRSEMLSQIRKAQAVLGDPLQRFEYDIEHGFKRDFSGQALTKRADFIPLQFSESIEALDTVKIPGELDYEKIESSIAAMERVAQVKRKPDIESVYGSESTINYANDQLPLSIKMDAVKPISKSESVKSLQFPSNTDINLKQHDSSLFTDSLNPKKYKGTDISHNVKTGKNTSNKPVCEKNSKEMTDTMKKRKRQVVPSEEKTKLFNRLKEDLVNGNFETDFTVDSKSIYKNQGIGNQQILVPKEMQTLSKEKEFSENGLDLKHVDSVQLARKYFSERKRDTGTRSALEYEEFGPQKAKTSVRLKDEISIISADSEDAISTSHKSTPFNKISSNSKQDFKIDGRKDTAILSNENKSLKKDVIFKHVDSHEIIQDYFSKRKTNPNVRNVSEDENNNESKSSLTKRGDTDKSISDKHKRVIKLSDEVKIIPRLEVKSDEGMPTVSSDRKSSHSYLRKDFETDETRTYSLLPEEIDEIIKHSKLVDKILKSRRNTVPDNIGSTVGDKVSDRRLSLPHHRKEDEISVSTNNDTVEFPLEEEISSEASERSLIPSSSYTNLNRLLMLEEGTDSKDSPTSAQTTDDEEFEYSANECKHSRTVNHKNNHCDKGNTKLFRNSSKDSIRNSSASNSKNNFNDNEHSEMSQSASKDSRHNTPATNTKNNPKRKGNSKMSPNSSEEESDKRATSENQITSDDNPTASPDLDEKKMRENVVMKVKR